MDNPVVNFVDIQNVISACNEHKIKIQLTDDEQLKVSSPDGVIDRELLKQIKTHKAALIEFLKDVRQKSSFENIEAAEKKPFYDVSPAQRRLWILSQFKENKSNFHIPAAFTFHGKYRPDLLKATFEALIERHEILRTTFVSIKGEPKQEVCPFDKFEFNIDYLDLRSITESSQEAAKVAKEEASAPFDLEKGPLFRVKVIQLKDEEFVLLFTKHHIISDGWSMKILLRDLQHFYHAFENNSTPALEPLKIQYKDYALWLNRQLSGAKLQQQKDFWHAQFREKPVSLDLPVDFNRPPVLTSNGNTVKTIVPAEVLRELKALSNQSGTSLFMTLLAAVNVLLHRYTGKEDICIGSPIAGRVHSDLEEQVGFYLNNLVFRTRFDGQESFLSLLASVKETCLNAFEHQLYPFEQLIDELNLAQDRSRSPLFDVVVVLQNTDLNLSAQQESDVEVKGFDTGYRVSTSDLRIEFTELKKGLELSIDYNTDLFLKERIELMLRHFRELFASLTATPQLPVCEFEYMDQEEKKFLLNCSSNTIHPLQDGATLVDLFEMQASKYPGRRAVTYRDTSLTFDELNQKANQLAHHLISFYKVKPGDIVGLMLDRSENLIVGIMGVLKAGAAYLPLDPDEPKTRKLEILNDASPRVLITESVHILNIGGYNCELFAMDSQIQSLTTPKHNLETGINPEDLAYVIYTSGSSGTPKGVMVEHKGVINVALDHSRRFGIVPEDATALFFPISFDASVFKIFMTLLSGAGLVILDEEMIFDPHECLDHLKKTGTTIASFTPSYINLFNPEALGFLKAVISGGEAPKYKQTLACSEYTRVFNAYGPSECSVCATIKEVGKDDRARNVIPIGSPIANVQTFIADDAERLVPAGIPGEIWISGMGVARGYLNQPELTDQRFVPNPFGEGRIYRSGDLGKWHIDGQIEFLGRKDRQVKIRGFRIELGEIEATLASMPELNMVYVKVIKEQNGDKQLVAYYTSNSEVDDNQLKAYCSGKLPGYMVPSFYIRLEEFPLNANSKIDADALPGIDSLNGEQEKDYKAPTNDLERQIVEVWEQQLGNEKIGIARNFFSAGGDSIKAIRVAGAINKLLGTNIEVKEIFEYQDVASLAAHIRGLLQTDDEDAGHEKAKLAIEHIKRSILDNEAYSSLLPEGWEDIYPMSEIQKGMVFYTLMNPTSGVYHDQMYYQFEDGSFELPLFKQAIDLLVERQSIFRTSFHLHDFGEGMQIVHKYGSFDPDFEFVSLIDTPDEEKSKFMEAYLKADREKSFNFSKPGIWRIRIFHLTENEYGFLLVGHHAIIDGWSDASFRTELSNVYFKLKENVNYKPDFLKVSYKDYIIDQYHHQTSGNTKKFWKEYLEGYHRMELPFHRSNKVSHASRQQVSYLFSLSPDLTTQLFQYSKQHDIGIKDICLAALAYMLKLTTNTDDITLGLLTNGRPSLEDADKVFGCFLNTVPFRQRIDNTVTNRKYLEAVRENSRQTKYYDKLPLTSIIEVIGEKTGSTNPVFDVLFNFVNMHIISQVHDDAKLRKPIVKGYGETNTLLDLVVNCSEGHIQAFLCSYNDIYEQDEIKRLAQYFQRILQELVSEDEKLVDNRAIIGKQELNLFSDFNKSTTVYPNHESISSLFELQVQKTPEKPALVYHGQEISYTNLNAKANRLAHYLRSEYKITSNDRIGIMLGRSEAMFVSIMGILKSGAAYVPVDPSHPAKRIATVLNEADVKLLITESELIFELSDHYSGSLFAIDLQFDDLEQNEENPKAISTANDLAYVMFTSGSTGKPKGVAVEQKSVIRLVKDTCYADLKPEDHVLQLSNYAFDGSVFDIFGALLNGSTLFVPDQETILSHTALSEYIRKNGITTTFITTALFNNIVELSPETISGLDKIYFGGEEASLKHIRKALEYRKQKESLVHVYGPTENTTFSTYYIIENIADADTLVPIGKPISNTTVHILNDDLEQLPVGVVGEICLGGEGLARGYWRNESLTKEKFVEISMGQNETSRIYRTGDLGRWTSDGLIYFCGRKDDQVKIRGNRVELREVEAVMRENDGIEQVHVAVRQISDNDKAMVAYYVGKINDHDKFRASLEHTLPTYMVPSYLIKMDALPLNKNGKIDKNALPDPIKIGSDDTSYEAPVTEIEQALIKIWEKVLNRSGLGMNANFFELGGHSLKATQLVYYIAQELNCDVQLRDIFASPTVREIADIIKASGKGKYDNILQIEEQEYYDVSHAQKRLWIHHQHDADSKIYHIPGIYRFKGSLNIEALEMAFRTLISRHESLRTVFKMIEGTPRQIIKSSTDTLFSLETIDCRALTGEEAIEARVREERGKIMFDLEQGPLLVTKLLQLNGDEYLFLFFMHHIVSDGWSMGVLMKEITELYEHYNENKEIDLPGLTVQYKDYTAWHNLQLSGDRKRESQLYWHEQLGGELPVLDMPTDLVRPEIKGYEGASYEFVIEELSTEKINKFVAQHQTSLFTFLEAVTKVLLYKYSGQSDIILGTPIAGREHVDLENQIGFYLNTLALRTKLDSSGSFDDLMNKVKEDTFNAYAHQLYPFDNLVDELAVEVSQNRSPFFDIMIVLQNMGLEEKTGRGLSGVAVSGFKQSDNYMASKYDITFFYTSLGGRISGNIAFNTGLFEVSTIRQMADDLKYIINNVLEDSQLKIADLGLLSDVDSKERLNAFIN